MSSPQNSLNHLNVKPDVESFIKYQSEKWDSGNRVTVEQLCEQLNTSVETLETDFLLTLICHEVALRESCGEKTKLIELQTRFPSLANELEIQWQIDRFIAADSVATHNGIGARTVNFAGDKSQSSDKNLPAIPPAYIGRYEILCELGRGGVGVVYEAWDPNLKRRVAIKRLRLGLDSSADDLQRFRSEAESVASITHHNVVQIFDIGEHNGQPFLAVELCNGGTLSKRLEGKPLNPRVAAELVANIALGVSAAHQNRVIHRDLKPSNILLETEDSLNPKISDFGLAKHLDTDGVNTRTGFILGTPAYMAPEQTEGGNHDVNAAIDIYALGTILYECLTGRAPFKGINVSETLELVRKNEPLSIRRLEPTVPIDLETISMKCLRKEPEQRYSTANDVADDLQRFLDHRPIHAKRKHMVEHFSSWCRRNPWLSGAAIALAAIIATSIGLLSWMYMLVRIESQQKTDALVDRTNALLEKSVALTERETAYQAAKLNETLANQRYYDARIFSAQQAILRQETSRAEDLLQPFDLQQSNFIGYEWKLLKKILFRDLKWKATGAIPGEIIDLDVSPDGKFVLAGGGDLDHGFYRLYDANDGKLLIEEDTGVTVNACGFAPSSNKFVVCQGNGLVRFFGVDQTEPVGSVETRLASKSMAWGKNGEFIYVGDENGRLGVIDADSFSLLKTIEAERGPILRMFLSEDGARLYTSVDWGKDDMHSTLWSIADQIPIKLKEFPGMSLTDESQDGSHLCGMHWGDYIVADSQSDQIVESSPASSGPLLAVAFNSTEDNLFLATRYDRELRVIDRSNMQIKYSYPMPHSLSAAYFSDSHLATGDVQGEIRFWSRSHQSNVDYETPSDFNYFTARFLPNSHDVLLGSADATKIWSPVENVVRPFSDAKSVVACTNNGNVLISRDVAKGETKLSVSSKSPDVRFEVTLPYEIFEQAIAVSKSGRWLATRGQTTKLDVFDIFTGQAAPAYQLSTHCVSMSFAPDDSMIAAGEQGGDVRSFDLSTGTPYPNYAQWQSFWSWAMSTAFSRDGRYLASGTESGVISVWEKDSQKLLSKLTGTQGEVRCLAFFPDNRRIVSGGSRSIRIWDYQAGQQLLSLPVPGRKTVAVEVNDSGDAILALSDDGRVCVWTVQ